MKQLPADASCSCQQAAALVCDPMRRTGLRAEIAGDSPVAATGNKQTTVICRFERKT
jgi:hypothetical protein